MKRARQYGSPALVNRRPFVRACNDKLLPIGCQENDCRGSRSPRLPLTALPWRRPESVKKSWLAVHAVSSRGRRVSAPSEEICGPAAASVAALRPLANWLTNLKALSCVPVTSFQLLPLQSVSRWPTGCATVTEWGDRREKVVIFKSNETQSHRVSSFVNFFLRGRVLKD